MTNEIKFADTVILVDVAYVDRVAGDLSKHFGDVVGRKLPKADLPVLLECLSLDSGIPLGENAVQVLFIYDEESKKMDAFQPSDLEKEITWLSKASWESLHFILSNHRIWLVAKSCFWSL